MADAPIGRHYRDLYYEHTRQIAILLLLYPELRSEGTNLLVRFVPGLQALENGQGKDMITASMVQDVQTYLDALAETAAQNNNVVLAEDIARERARINWNELTGKTFDEAWRYLNTLEPTKRIFLPFVANR